MKKNEVHFESKAHERAHKLLNKVINALGGPSEVSKITGMLQARASLLCMGSIVKGQELRKQVLPTPEQAIKLAIAANDEKITAEKLLPGHNFKYIYDYVKSRGK